TRSTPGLDTSRCATSWTSCSRTRANEQGPWRKGLATICGAHIPNPIRARLSTLVPSPRFRRIRLAAAVPGVLTTVLCILVLGACRRAAETTPPPAKVTVAHPVERQLTDWDEYTARLEAIDSVEVRARVSGYLESVHFREGS